MVYGTHRPLPFPIEGMVQCAALILVVWKLTWSADSWDMSQVVQGGTPHAHGLSLVTKYKIIN